VHVLPQPKSTRLTKRLANTRPATHLVSHEDKKQGRHHQRVSTQPRRAGQPSEEDRQGIGSWAGPLVHWIQSSCREDETPGRSELFFFYITVLRDCKSLYVDQPQGLGKARPRPPLHSNEEKELPKRNARRKSTVVPKIALST
jgi:hypothetical protein